MSQISRLMTKLGTVVWIYPLVLNAKYEEDSTVSSKVMAILNSEKWTIFRCLRRGGHSA